MEQSICAADDCANTKVIARGLCRKHYQRLWLANREAMAAERPTGCSLSGCTNNHHSFGLCQKHYTRQKKHGSTDDPRPSPIGCEIAGCRNPHNSRGLCSTHAARRKKHGNPNEGGRPESHVILVHGTPKGYKHFKCRCDACREARRVYELEWRSTNLEVGRRASARRRKLFPDADRAAKRRWRYMNPEKVKSYTAARAAAPFDEAAVDYAEIILRDPCVFCGQVSGQIDHILPLAKGGGSEWTNLAPACGSCNGSKGKKNLLDFLLYRLAN